MTKSRIPLKAGKLFILVILLLVSLSAIQSRAENYAIQFDGVDDYIEVPHHSSFNWSQQATIECWVRIFNSNAGVIFNKWRSGYEDKQLVLDSRRKVTFHLHGLEPPGTNRWSRTVLNLDQWYHVTGTARGDSLFIYINGYLDTSWAASGSYIGNSGNPAIIGAVYYRPGCLPITGEIDELRIWNIYKTPEEIRSMMFQGASGNEQGLVAVWHFNEGQGQTAYDSSPNQNDGRLGSSVGQDPEDPQWVSSTAPINPGAIAGVVTEAIGMTPIDAVLVEAVQDEQVIAFDHSNADGTYEIPFLLAGTYDVRASRFGYETQTQYGVTIEENQTTVVDFELVPLPTGDVSGFVFDALTQSGLGGVLAQFQQNSQTLYSTSSEAGTGLYELWAIPIGDYIVRYSKDGYVTEHVSVTIEAGWNILSSIYLDPGQLLFVDHFTGSASPLWTTLHGDCNWQVIDNTYTTSLVGTSLLCKKAVLNQDWANYVFEVDVKGNAGADKVVLFRIQDELNSYDVNLRSDWEGKDEILFDRLEDGVTNTLAIVEYPSENGRWYHLKIACVDETFTIFVDGEQVIQYTDIDNPIYRGGIGVACWTGGANECDIAFDNVQVLDIFPRFTYQNIDGYQLGDEVTMDGLLEYWDGTPMVPQSGFFGVENPMREVTQIVFVDPDGSFNATVSPTGGADEPGFFMLNFGVGTKYGSVRKKVNVGISDPDPLVNLPVYHETQTGPLPNPPEPQTAVISEKRGININPPPGFLPAEIAKAWFKQVKPWYQGAWAKFTESTAGKVILSGFEMADKKCRTEHNLGACGAAMGLAVETGASMIIAPFQEAFHDLINIAEQDMILYPEEANTARFMIDAGFFVEGIVSLKKMEGFVNVLKNVDQMIQLVPDYIDFIEKYLPPLPDVLDGRSEQPYFAMYIEDTNGEIYILSAYPKIDKMCTVRGFSPIELRVTDPLGRIIDKDNCEIPDGYYIFVDTDQDGDSESIVSFPMDTVGEVLVEVIPDTSAQPEDTFSVSIDYSYFLSPVALAEGMRIMDIPPSGFSVETFENLPPDSFNLISPNDTVFPGFPVTLIWESTTDPNPEHSVHYRVVISTSPDFSDSVLFDGVIDTFFSFDGSLEGGKGLIMLDSASYFWKVYASDLWVATVSNQTNSFGVEYFRGDANGDGVVDGADIVYLLNYLYRAGDPPEPIAAGDANSDGVVDGSDVVYLLNYLYRNGPPPCSD